MDKKRIILKHFLIDISGVLSALSSMEVNSTVFGFSLRAILITACSLFSLNTWAANLYVSPSGSDSNSGSQSAPLRTISKAASLASAGSTVHVADGTYNENVVTNSNGTSNSYITYISDHKWGAKVVSSNSASGAAAWHNNGDNVAIIGFDISGAGAVGINHSGNNDIANQNHVHDIPAAYCDGYGGGAIIFDQYNIKSGGTADSNLVHDIGPLGTNCFRVQGVYTSVPNVTISNNIIYRVVGYATTNGHCSYNVKIINNTMFANGGSVEGGAVVMTNNGNCSLPSNGNVVANNIIFDNVLGVHEEGTVSTDTTIYSNNLVFGNKTNWGAIPSGSSHINDVSANPTFINYQANGSGDYHLVSSSPAIDKGSSKYAPAKDFDSGARPQGAAADIGAYEYGSSAPPPTPSPTPQPAGTPVISLSSKSLAFGNLLIGSTSAVQILTITNSGNADLIFSSDFGITGDFAFGGAGNCQLAVSYAPGSSCTASVVFAPTVLGARSGALSIQSNASSSPLSIALSGSGVVVDSIAPVTSITAPANPSSAAVYSYVTIKAQASDNIAVKTLEFYVNGSLKCTVSAAPYQCVWRVPRYRRKTYSLQTKAYDAAGNVGVSNRVSVTSK